jgi:hypothetical protein
VTHILTDEEYQEYLKIKAEHKELKCQEEIMMNQARRMLTPYDRVGKRINVPRYSVIDNLFNRPAVEMDCSYAPHDYYYCDHCLPGWILEKCPFGHPKKYSI